MPLLEFECEKCQNRFETLVFTDEDKENVTCPTCHSKQVEIQLSTFGVGKSEGKVNSNPSGGNGGSCCGGSCGCM